jgi:hypothetical protein
VPDKVPLDRSFSPAGSDPEVTDQVYGVVPPSAPSFTEYGVLVYAVGRLLAVVITSEATPTAMDRLAVAVWNGLAESATSTVKSAVPRPSGCRRPSRSGEA